VSTGTAAILRRVIQKRAGEQ